MTQFQHLASSTGKSAVNRPVSKLLTHVSLWTVHAVELRSQQIERPAWPHAGQQMVSHCYLEGCTKPYIHSNSSLPTLLLLRTYGGGDTAESRNTPLSPKTLRQINAAQRLDFKEILTYHRTMHDVAKCSGNCNTGTITTVQILCSINRNCERNTLQILITAPQTA